MVHFPKSQPPPESLAIQRLKPNGKYDCNDVLIRLRDDFKEKCYICEEGDINSTNIEHHTTIHRLYYLAIKFKKLKK